MSFSRVALAVGGIGIRELGLERLGEGLAGLIGAFGGGLGHAEGEEFAAGERAFGGEFLEELGGVVELALAEVDDGEDGAEVGVILEPLAGGIGEFFGLLKFLWDRRGKPGRGRCGRGRTAG